MGNRRTDLQGLRAVAVAMVIAYHLSPAILPGGFVGVDVFFVLSGFFITRKLFWEAEETGKLNLLEFWAARAKRLLPNALLTLAFVVLVSAAILPSFRRSDIALDVISAASFWSNFHFAAAAVDYFRLDEPPSPVLHFWSLSVEEQFYIAFPFLLFLTLPLLRARPLLTANILLTVVIATSLAASTLMTQGNAAAAFYSPFARAWQLAAGGVLAINFERRRFLPALGCSLITWLGLAAIAYAAIRFSDDLAYPGLYALLPTLGTVALIAGIDGEPSPRSVLVLPGFGWVGDRSYSLYLWHWPIITFAEAVVPPGIPTTVATLLIIILISTAAYHYVERPIHQAKEVRWWPTLNLAAAAIATLSILAGSLTILPMPPGSAVRSAEIARASSDLGDNYPNGCHLQYSQFEQPACLFGAPGATKSVVLFGDSHAAQWFSPLRTAADKTGWQLRAWTKTNCPATDIKIWYAPRKVLYTECSQWRSTTMAAIAALKPDLVIIASAADYAGEVYKNGVLFGAASVDEWQRGTLRTIHYFLDRGIRVAAIRDNPQMFRSYKDCIEAGDAKCGRARDDALRASADDARLLASLAELTLLDLSDDICGAYYCPAWRDGEVLYKDRTHLTATFAARLWQRFAHLLVTEKLIAGE